MEMLYHLREKLQEKLKRDDVQSHHWVTIENLDVTLQT